MTDRELLELAAKAAEIERGEDRFDCAISITENGRHRSLPQWNPVESDGDALRLAVQLKLAVVVSGQYSWAYREGDHLGSENEIYEMHYRSRDPFAATRRAIVRAAAEIGKDME